MSSEALEAKVAQIQEAYLDDAYGSSFQLNVAAHWPEIMARLAEVARLRNRGLLPASEGLTAGEASVSPAVAPANDLWQKIQDQRAANAKLQRKYETVKGSLAAAEAALAVTREREQRAVDALREWVEAEDDIRRVSEALTNEDDNAAMRYSLAEPVARLTNAQRAARAALAATLAEPGRGEWKPPARVGEECSPVTADVTTPAPGSASAAARDRLVASTIDAGPLPRPSDVAELLAAEVAMREQAVETLRNLHDSWRQIVEAQDVDGGPLIENILYWLIEDLKPDAALSEPGSPTGKGGLGRPGSASAAADAITAIDRFLDDERDDRFLMDAKALLASAAADEPGETP